MASRVDNSFETVQQHSNAAEFLNHAAYDNAAFENISNGNIKAATTNDEKRSDSTQRKAEKPSTCTNPKKDSGYAWMILFMSCLTRIVCSSGDAMTGVLLLELTHKFDASALELNVAATLELGVLLCSSMFTGLFVSRYGSKITTIIGSVLATIGYVATSFAPNIHVIIFTFGVISGIGFGFLQMGSLFSLYEYFEMRKGLAMGVFTASGYVGQFIWPLVATVLFNYYGLSGSFMILAGIVLNVCIVGALMRPFPKDKDDTQNKRNTSGYSYLKTQVRIFQNKPFVAYCGILFVVSSAYAYAMAYLPTLADDIGASETNAALLVSMVGVSGGVASVICGLISDAPWFRNNRLVICIIAFTLCGIDKIVSTKAATYTHLAVFAVADGVSTGAYVSLIFAIISDLVKVEHQGLAGGIGGFSAGLGLLIGNPATGWMYSHYGSLVVPAVVMGCVQILGAVLATWLYIYIRYNENKIYTVTVL